MTITGRRLTLEEFLALPEDEPALEYADGEVTQKVSPMGRHGRLQPAIANLFERPGVSYSLTETRTTYAGRSYVPDVIAFVWDRIPQDEHGEIPDIIPVPPDIAVEIRSPGQSVRDQIARCRWYVANGVRASVFVDPIRRVVETFRPDRESGPLAGDAVIDLTDVIPDCRFTASELFAALRAR